MPFINYTFGRSNCTHQHNTKSSIVATEQTQTNPSQEEIEIDRALSMEDGTINTRDLEIETVEKDDVVSETESSSCDSTDVSINHDDDLNDDYVELSTTRKQISSILSTSKCKNKKKNDMKKPRVKFGDLEMRFYNRRLGDNPACTSGAPVELDWTYNKDTFSTSINEYETHRLPRRSRRQLAMTSITRRNMMIYHFGCTHDQIDRAAQGTKKIQRQRQKTKTLSPAVERRQEMTESFTKMFFRRSRSKDNLLTFEQKRTIEAYENDHLNQLLMVR